MSRNIPIRVVHVSPIDTMGGAARGAYGLHKALQEEGIDSRMLVLRKYSDDASVLTGRGARGPNILIQALRDRLDRLPLRLYDWDPAYFWTVGWLPFDITGEIEALDPDVVHFHWAGRGAAPIGMLPKLARFSKVWTLRDMWPLTGGCHYSGNCDRFRIGCGQCPQLGSNTDLDISAWQWARKRRAWRDVNIIYVAPSRWMADCALASPLRHQSKVLNIPNGVDVTQFKPIDRTAARHAWNLPQDRTLIMFGAINSTDDPRKGFRYFVEAMRTVTARQGRDSVMAVVFGAATTPDIDLGCETRYFGQLHDNVSLATLYSAADLMVVPSVQENAGKTSIEAMACGTPVVAFSNTGQVEIIDHQRTGYLAQDLSSEDLARGIEWCLEANRHGGALSRQARERAAERFDIRKVARLYVGLYQSLLARRSACAAEVQKASLGEVLPGDAEHETLSASPPSGRLP